MTPPRVSVVLPVYNGERHVDAAIASVLAEELDALELVVVDDGSTDATPALLREWRARDARVVVVTLERNRGLAHALNRGLEAARGEYIARQDGDDIYVRGRIPEQMELLERERDVVLVSTWFDIIDEHGHRTGTYAPVHSSDAIHYLLNFYNVIGGHAQVMYRRDAALRAGGYDEELSTVEDYDLWRRLRHAGRIMILPRIGLLRRHHAAGVSFAQRAHQRQLSDRVMRLALAETLGRPIADEEAAAINTLWRGEYHAGVAAVAIRASREATRGVRDARRVLVRRLVLAAARALRRRYFRDCVIWLGGAVIVAVRR